MKTLKYIMVIFFAICLALPSAALAGNGFMGGRGKVVVEDEPNPDAGGDGGMPGTVVGPETDKMAAAGSLFGDLYKILRYQGGVELQMYVDNDLDGKIDDINDDGEINADDYQPNTPIGGSPVLSEGYGVYALEVSEGAYVLATATYPSQCVQPVASFAKWGNINVVTGLDSNRLPLIMTYDTQWERTECAVGELIGDPVVDSSTGAFTTPTCSDAVTNNCINPYFETPSDACPDGILWADMVDEVRFGRLNLSRSPEAVLQAAFDEAIGAINSDDTVGISRDAAGRLLLEKNVYSETEVDDCGDPLLLGTTQKAIDSPLENLALYVKLMKDGHLVTPGDERAPIDRSEKGGIPLWKMLELADGPSDALRPTVNIMDPDNPWRSKFAAAFPNLVDVSAFQSYYTYYECYSDDAGLVATPCLCNDTNHDGAAIVVACPEVVSRELKTVDSCPGTAIPTSGPIPNDAYCMGDEDGNAWYGIKTDDCPDNDCAAGDDFDFAAAFLAAAADKTGEIGVDMIVYVNSILGINQVVGYSAYDDDGNPEADAVDYSKNPVYINYSGVPPYDRTTVVSERGDGGSVSVLQSQDDLTWTVTSKPITTIPFDNLGLGTDGLPDGGEGTINILGFTQMADDDLSIIKFVHTYQIPGLR